MPRDPLENDFPVEEYEQPKQKTSYFFNSGKMKTETPIPRNERGGTNWADLIAQLVIITIMIVIVLAFVVFGMRAGQ